MSELAVLVQPAAFLVTQDGGTHEITRCYWQHGKYSVGSYSNARIGQFTVVHARLNCDLELEFTGGYIVRIPESRLQSTHRV